MNLFIIRHAIAAEAGSAGFADDSQRPLTEKGRMKMEAVARGLHSLNVNLDLILSSPYLRARETADILADVFKMRARPALNENLTPMGDIERLIGEIKASTSVENLALVGHEPSLSALISMLLAGTPEILVNMKKGGVCCLTLDNMRKDQAMLEWLLTPSQLITLGE
jgi:phosphohistidine phosphatase